MLKVLDRSRGSRAASIVRSNGRGGLPEAARLQAQLRQTQTTVGSINEADRTWKTGNQINPSF